MKLPAILTLLALGLSAADAEPYPWLSDPKDKEWKPDILWSTATGSMNGEVTIAGDAVLVGGNNGISSARRSHSQWTRVLPPRASLDEYDNALICLEAKTGALRWRAVHPQVSRPEGIPCYGLTSKPAVAGDRVYYLSVNWELVCADLEGFRDGENDGPWTGESLKEDTDADIVWKIDLRKDLGVMPRCAGDIGYVQSSPLVIDRLVYVVTGNGGGLTDPTHVVPAPGAPSFLAVDRFTGKVAWSSNAPGKDIIWMQGGSPAAMPERGEVVFPGGDGCLYGFDAVSGKQHWKADLNAIGGTRGLFFECTPLVVKDTVIASLRHCIESGPQAGAPLIAIKPGKPGEPAATAWVFGKDRGGFSSQLLAREDLVYAVSVSTGREGTNLLHAIDPASGREKWHLAAGDKDSGLMGLGGEGNRLYLPDGDEGILRIIEPRPVPRLIRSIEFSTLGISPRYSRAVSSPHGLCLPLRDGIIMLRDPEK